MIKKTALYFSLFFLFLLSACSTQKTVQNTNHENNSEIEEVKALLISNLDYAETKNIEGYLSTIPLESHNDTREAMEDFFGTYTVKHTLVDFEVVKVFDDEIVAKARQKTEEENTLNDSEYKNHIAETLHVFKKIEGEWKITDSSVTDITFID